MYMDWPIYLATVGLFRKVSIQGQLFEALMTLKFRSPDKNNERSGEGGPWHSCCSEKKVDFTHAAL